MRAKFRKFRTLCCRAFRDSRRKGAHRALHHPVRQRCHRRLEAGVFPTNGHAHFGPFVPGVGGVFRRRRKQYVRGDGGSRRIAAEWGRDSDPESLPIGYRRMRKRPLQAWALCHRMHMIRGTAAPGPQVLGDSCLEGRRGRASQGCGSGRVSRRSLRHMRAPVGIRCSPLVTGKTLQRGGFT